MPKRLNAAELERRLRLDERMMALINTDPAPMRVSAHRTANDARRGVNAIACGSGPAPEHYRVVYAFDTLSARDVRHSPTVVHIDLLANGGYPFSEPVCRTVGVTPWTPHFSSHYPICIGDGWPDQTARNAGTKLAVDLAVHIARLLNFDEPRPKPGYHGYNGAAIDWWRRAHDCRPLNPNLRYPIIDPNDPGTIGPARGTRIGPAGGRFAPRVLPVPVPAAHAVRFTAVKAPARTTADPGRFAPVSGGVA